MFRSSAIRRLRLLTRQLRQQQPQIRAPVRSLATTVDNTDKSGALGGLKILDLSRILAVSLCFPSISRLANHRRHLFVHKYWPIMEQM